MTAKKLEELIRAELLGLRDEEVEIDIVISEEDLRAELDLHSGMSLTTANDGLIKLNEGQFVILVRGRWSEQAEALYQVILHTSKGIPGLQVELQAGECQQ